MTTALDRSTVAPPAGPSAELLREMLRKMYRVRLFEEMMDRLFAEGRVHGTMHLSIGQEASSVGAVSALEPTDYLLSTHRGHGHALAKGAEARRMLAEFMGKDAGYCHGLGGSMHIANVEDGNLGANGIVAGGLPISVGVGLAIKMRGWPRVCLAFFGDGAANEGGFHEALNLAAIWKLPIVFVCENNGYAMSMPFARAFPTSTIASRAAAYGLPGVVVDGNDVLAVYEATREAAARARAGEGPSLLELKTYRWKGHSKSDANRYRTRDEIERWKQRDPIARFRERLLDEGLLTVEQADAIAREEAARIEDALAFAEAAPEPTMERLLGSIYA